VAPGETFEYEYRLPDDHPPGVYWYHPHHHHTVADQVFGGLYGAIVVEDAESLPVSRDRVLVVSDITLDAADRVATVSGAERMAGREGEMVLVDGALRPVLTARPGERERWRIVNACTARYLRLRLGRPANAAAPYRLRAPRRATRRRRDRAHPGQPRRPARHHRRRHSRAARAARRPRRHDRDDGRPRPGRKRLSHRGAGRPGRFAVTGPATAPLPPVPARAAVRDLRAEPVATRRGITFAMGMGAARAWG
jgi:hypothetical protein